MKALDKIYVNFEDDYFVPAIDRKTNCEIEYIRKDSLMEWVKENNRHYSAIGVNTDDNFARGIAAGLEYVIEKLDSM